MSLSEAQLTDLKAAFAEIDTNSDGFITKDELKALFGKMSESVDEAMIDEMMAAADTNGDGKVDFAEFCAAQAK